MAEATAAVAEEDTGPEDAGPAGTGGGGDAPAGDCPPCKGGAPAWMATFADMATLLMAFFVLLLSFSDVELPKFEQVNGSMQNAFGVRRLIPSISLPMARNLIVENFTPALAERTVIPDVRQVPIDPYKENLIRRTREFEEKYPQQTDLNRVQAALAEEIERGEVTVSLQDQEIVVELSAQQSAGGPGGKGQGSASGGVLEQRVIDIAARLVEVQSQVSREVNLYLESGDAPSGAAEIARNTGTASQSRQAERDLYTEIRSNLRAEMDQGLVEIERDGKDVIIRLANQGSFGSGSADLDAGFLPLLRRVGEPLAADNRRMRIEGHTDNIPIVFSPRFNSNWDLSAARSAAVADFFARDLGISSTRMKVSGFADTVPLEPNTSAEGRARNRRIEIIVEGGDG
jgi:chemotaxis protein MotB